MIQMKCSEPANRANWEAAGMHRQQQTISGIWYLVPDTWYLVSNVSYPIGFQDSSEESKKDYVEDSMDLDATSHGFRAPGNRGTWICICIGACNCIPCQSRMIRRVTVSTLAPAPRSSVFKTMGRTLVRTSVILRECFHVQTPAYWAAHAKLRSVCLLNVTRTRASQLPGCYVFWTCSNNWS